MEELLGELNTLCQKLGEAYAQHAKELADLRSEKDSREVVDLRSQKPCEKDKFAKNATLRQVSFAEEKEDMDAKSAKFAEMLPPGMVRSPEPLRHCTTQSSIGDQREEDMMSEAPSRASRAMTMMTMRDLDTPSRAKRASLYGTLGEGAFALRRSYIKSEHELDRLNAAEKAAAMDCPANPYNMRRSIARSFSANKIAYQRINDLVRNPVSSLTKRNWDMIGCFLLIWDVFVIPLGVFDLPPDPFLVLIEVGSVIYWTSDIFMTMTTGYYENPDDDEPVMEFKTIVRHYIASKNFPFDVSLVAIDWVITIITFRSIDSDAEGLSAVGLARLVRTGRVLRLLKLMRVSKFAGFMENLRRWFTFKIDRELQLLMIDLMKIFCVGALVFHYMVCGYYSVGKTGGAWLSRSPEIKEEPFVRKYITTGELMSRRANTVTRNMEKDIVTDVEKAFDALAWCVSTAFVTWLTSTVTSKMLERLQRQRERNDKMYYIRTHYLVKHQIDPRIRMQLLKFMDKGYADYRAAQQRHKHEAELLESLPVQLAKDFRREAWNPVLSEHGLFNFLTGHVMEDLCLNAVSEIFCRKREVLFKQSAVCSRMLFVFEGQYAYVMNGSDFNHGGDSLFFDSSTIRLSKGSWLSEPVLWTTSWQHRGTLLSIDSGYFCAVFPESLESVLKSHENALHDVVRYAAAFVDQLNMEAICRAQGLSDVSDHVMEKALNTVRPYLED